MEDPAELVHLLEMAIRDRTNLRAEVERLRLERNAMMFMAVAAVIGPGGDGEIAATLDDPDWLADAGRSAVARLRTSEKFARFLELPSDLG